MPITEIVVARYPKSLFLKGFGVFLLFAIIDSYVLLVMWLVSSNRAGICFY